MSNSQNETENRQKPLNSAYDLPEKSQQLYVYGLEHDSHSGVKVFAATQKVSLQVAEFKTIDEGYQFLRMCSLARLSPDQAGAAAMFFQKQAAEEQAVSVKELIEERDDLKEKLKQETIKSMELGAGVLLLRKANADLEKDLQASQDPVLLRQLEERAATISILKKRLQQASVAQSASAHQDFTDLSEQLKVAQDLIEQQRVDIHRLSTSTAALVTRLEKEKRGSLEGTKDVVALRRVIACLEEKLEKARKDLEAANKRADKYFSSLTRMSMHCLRQEDTIASLESRLP